VPCKRPSPPNAPQVRVRLEVSPRTDESNIPFGHSVAFTVYQMLNVKRRQGCVFRLTPDAQDSLLRQFVGCSRLVLERRQKLVEAA
jgi:hypothetical protein